MEDSGIALSWSGGKDSALALHELLRTGYRVSVLLTTIADGVGRVSHHGVREELLDAQAAAIGIPLVKVRLPTTRGGSCANPEYESAIETAMLELRDGGITTVAHGDLFLADLRAYRERNLARAGMHAIFPLWGTNTCEIVLRFVSLGFRARLCCVDSRLGPAFAGREIDDTFLAELPKYVDPAGENGEYHSFVYDGPVFRRALRICCGETVTRDGRTFIDLELERESIGVKQPVEELDRHSAGCGARELRRTSSSCLSMDMPPLSSSLTHSSHGLGARPTSSTDCKA